MEGAAKRVTQVLFEKEKWSGWVRDVQDEEEANRDKEQKKLKQEAALFKRHMKQLEARLNRMRQKEEQKRQDAFLEDAYKERMAMLEDETDDEAWDPIEDLEDDKWNRYFDLIKHFLWMDLSDLANDDHTSIDPPSSSEVATPAPAEEPEALSRRNKKIKKASTTSCSSSAHKDSIGGDEMALVGQMKLLAMQQKGQHDTEPDLKEPDKNNIETEEEMRKRLSQRIKTNLDNIAGMQLVGTLENPRETWDRTAPMSGDEVDSLIHDIREIELLLFCRLILAHASLLPATLRASSVEEFLNDREVAETDLRDLCLKVSEPALQDIRDACADFARGDEADEELPSDDDYDDDETLDESLKGDRRYHHLHTHDWFGEKVLKEGIWGRWKKKKIKKAKPLRTKVTICGKSIWNHASESAMSRDGWLQFSVMAKDCDLKHAIQLCRNWNESSDLNLPTLGQYFPASNWTSWSYNRFSQQLQQLGFFPYFNDLDADGASHHHQVGGRSQLRRQHDIVGMRNVIVGNMKRNDPVKRRFIQYLLMRTGEPGHGARWQDWPRRYCTP
ncbi:hypothetical protein ACHAPJ_010354 [Fusarium lateritium]